MKKYQPEKDALICTKCENFDEIEEVEEEPEEIEYLREYYNYEEEYGSGLKLNKELQLHLSNSNQIMFFKLLKRYDYERPERPVDTSRMQPIWFRSIGRCIPPEESRFMLAPVGIEVTGISLVFKNNLRYELKICSYRIRGLPNF